jgi:hypothetical protein
METIPIYWYLDNTKQNSTISFYPCGNVYHVLAECVLRGKYWLDRDITPNEYSYIKNYITFHNGDMTKFDKM